MNTIRDTANQTWTFLRTEMEPESKPLLLSIADRILYPWTYTEINSDGFPIKKARQISCISDIEDSKFYAKAFDFISFGYGVGACAFTVTLGFNTIPALCVYTVCSIATKILLEKGFALIDTTKSKIIIIITGIAVINFFVIGISFSASIILITPINAIFEVDGFPRLFYLSTIIKVLAFNFFVGILLKFIVYKIYPAVQNVYDKFFANLKAGEKDPRRNGDIILHKKFENHITPTYFDQFPPEMFTHLIKFFSSKNAFDFRLCSKALFSLISNRDYLTIKINENFFFGNTSDKKIMKFQNKLLKILKTCPLNLRFENRDKNGDLLPTDKGMTGTLMIKDYIMQNPNKIYLIRSHLNLLYIGQRFQDKITITDYIPHAKTLLPAFTS